jgi:hypothetical protein
MIEIRVIPPEELKSWWPFVRPGLQTILRKSPEEWIPEDVYAQCLCKNALLWMYVENNKPLGFMVLVVRPETVHVWCLWSAVRDRLQEGSEVFWKTLREANIKRVTFDSWRPGWNRVAIKYGFSPRSWVKELV